MVNEQEKTEERKPEDSAENQEEGSKYETTPVIERAREEREKLEAAVKAMKEENDRRELIMSKQALGGITDAGQPKAPILSEEEKASRARIKAVADATGSDWGKKYE